VRRPARPAELRAGLDFFGTFCIKAKSTSNNFKACIKLFVLSFACAKERTKPACRQAGKNTPAMMYGHCRTP